MTIYDIKRLVSETSPKYFSRNTLKFFGQTMKGWHLKKLSDGRTRISQEMKDRFTGRVVGESVRYYNPETNILERE